MKRISVGRRACLGSCVTLLLLSGCQKSELDRHIEESSVEVRQETDGGVTAKTKAASFRILPTGYIRAELLNQAKPLVLDDADSTSAETLVTNGHEVTDWVPAPARMKISNAEGPIGKLGKRVEEVSTSSSSSLERHQIVEFYDDFPTVAFSTVFYKNAGTQTLQLDKVVSQSHRLNAALNDPGVPPFQMWSFHGSSEAWGKKDVLPISAKFARQNTMSTMMRNDENQTGGGVPVIAFWTASMGEVIGHVELLPIPLSMPVGVAPDNRVLASIVLTDQGTLRPGEIYSTPVSFVAVYHGDFYEPLRLYSSAMQRRGWEPAKPTNADYQVNWCGWGYELNFTAKQMLGTIPKLKELGVKWATLDAGWFTNRGDWEPRPETLPGDSLKKIVEGYHKEGIHLTLWWIPIVAEDGKGTNILNHRTYTVSNVVKEHPDWLILDRDGKPARLTASLGGLCPALPEVQEYYRKLTEKFIRDWDFDGNKLDFSYTVPPCFNPAHHHKSPNDSTYAMGEIYKIIFETTRALKPDSVTQSCPCGTPPNIAWLAYVDQAVTADPVGSAQVRLRTKMYKALLGPESAVYGDHVELTKVLGANTDHEVDVGRDFASSLGTGAVLGTKFTWPDYGPRFKSVQLTPEKEALWKKWIDIYDKQMLSRGVFRDLYIYGVDFPEAYAIEKDGKMYYAFFAANDKDPWSGTLELRGLTPGKYSVSDYVNGIPMGTIDASDPKLPGIQFTDHLLLEVSRQ